MSNEQPFVDVIIPAYNSLPWLKQTVESVLKQSHKNLYLYIIDDGSTDDGAAEKYIKTIKDSRIFYRRKKNGGQATARNLGIKISKSPYVALLDSDDVWHKDKLKIQLDILEENPETGMVYGLHYLIDEQDKRVGEVSHSRSGKLYYYLLGGNRISGSASMVMIKREVFDNVGLFHEDFLIGEDWEMWLKIAQKYKITCADEYLASLRVRSDAMQKDYLKMAKGLDYMLPVMLDEFKPGFFGRARLRGACLFDSVVYYYLADDLDSARHNLLKLLAYNPFRLKFRKDLIFIYARLLFANEGLRMARRTFSPKYRELERKAKLEEEMAKKNDTP